MIYQSNKKDVQDIKRFIAPHTQNKVTGPVPKTPKGSAGSPNNRHLPIRGQ